MTEGFAIQATEDDTGCRLDVVLTRHLSLSRSEAAAAIRDGGVLLNGSQAKPAAQVHAGDRIDGTYSRPAPLSATAESLPLRIVYQDTDLAVIDKAAGMVVHPSAGHRSGTVANALMSLFPQTSGVGGSVRPGIVHRLDKDTSGLLVVALSDASLRALQQQISTRMARREYLALAGGRVSPAEGEIEAPIGRDPSDRKRMAVHGISSRFALTHYLVLEALPGFSYLRVRLDTGRTHQIRVHFAAAGHPLAGDALYGGTHLAGLHRQFLHATQLTLQSPSSGAVLTFHSALPDDLRTVLEKLRS